MEYTREKYGIEKNLDHRCELILTKILIKKVIKAKQPLLTFELFQTKLKDGSSYSECEETDLDEEDNRIEAKLAMRIYDRLPNFSI